MADPVAVFDALWGLFDRNYGCFVTKNIDWNLLHTTYRPLVCMDSTDDELFAVLSGLLEHLNDNHVKLRSTDPPRFFRSGILGDLNRDAEGRPLPLGFNIPDFSLELVKERYLGEGFEESLRGTSISAYYGSDYPLYTFGWIRPGIGYLHLRNFDEEETTATIMDGVIARFRDARGVVVDVRGNGGGLDAVAKTIADRFADTRRLFMTTRTRNGPRHDDFEEAREWFVEPRGPLQFTKPVVMLTHRWTVSAGDVFALAMRVLPHVVNLGDFSSGAYSDEYWDTLPNGWQVCVCNMLYLDREGRCWEGIGTPPDIRMVNTREDVASGRDRVLERALDLVNAAAGLPAPREDGS